jgi:RNA polymerase sigma-70 factor (ECF subfamily)
MEINKMFTDNQLVTEMDRLKKFAMRLTKNDANADDLLQNTVLRAMEKKHLFKEGSNVFSWTSKIMYNLFVSDYRRKVKFESQYDPEPAINSVTANIDHEDQMMLKEVGEAMNQLSNEHREILIMVSVQGMKYDETAEKLNIPVGTVRSRLSRARNILMDLMENNNSQGFSISDDVLENHRMAA